jgi:hypothetical protein
VDRRPPLTWHRAAGANEETGGYEDATDPGIRVEMSDFGRCWRARIHHQDLGTYDTKRAAVAAVVAELERDSAPKLAAWTPAPFPPGVKLVGEPRPANAQPIDPRFLDPSTQWCRYCEDVEGDLTCPTCHGEQVIVSAAPAATDRDAEDDDEDESPGEVETPCPTCDGEGAVRCPCGQQPENRRLKTVPIEVLAPALAEMDRDWRPFVQPPRDPRTPEEKLADRHRYLSPDARFEAETTAYGSHRAVLPGEPGYESALTKEELHAQLRRL